MANLVELHKLVLGGVVAALPDEVTVRNRMNVLLQHEERLALTSSAYSPIWTSMRQWYSKFNTIFTPDQLNKKANAVQVDAAMKMAAQYEELASQEISASQWQAMVYTLLDSVKSEELDSLLQAASNIHNAGITINRRSWAGYDDAMVYLREGMATLSYDEIVEEGVFNSEFDDIVEQYNSIKSGEDNSVATGFTTLDSISQLNPGDLWLIGGYTGAGKSKFVLNVGYDAAIRQGKNVIFLTNEVTRNQLRLGFVVRHSWNPVFGEEGLLYSRVFRGELDAAEERLFHNAAKDMSNVNYGNFYALGLPDRADIGYIRDVMLRCSNMFEPHLLIVDYLGLLRGSEKYRNRREELDDLLIGAKRLAVEYNIPLLSPWQINREAYARARDSEQYDLTSLSETSQAEKSSDLVLTILKNPDTPSSLKCQILKNRDGEAGAVFNLSADWATCRIVDGSNNEVEDFLASLL